MRRLTLARETLTELSADELRGVAGGYPTQVSLLDCLTCDCPTLPLSFCLTG